MKNNLFRLFASASLLLAGAVLPFNTNAAPYASDLTNNAGVISFRLNQNADNVKIISSGGAVTNDLGAGVKGLTTTNLGIVGVFKVVVSRSAPAGYTQLSADNYQVDGVYVNKFEQARGLAINKNPASPSFGRIFVGNARTGTTATLVRTTVDGIYMFNADNTPALDTHNNPRTAGLGFTSGTGDPNRLNIGKDDNLLYICDFTDPTGGLYVTDLDVVNGTNVLGAVGGPPATTDNHGSTYGAAIEGSLAGSNLKIFTIDEDLTPVRSVWRYDVGGSTLPYTGAQVGPLSTAPIANFTGDLVKGGDNNYLYFSQNRSSGIETNGPGVRIFDENGTVITDSQTASKAFLNVSTNIDILRNTIGLDLSPDGKTLAVIQGATFGGRVLFVPLVNGVFNFAGTNSFLVGSSSDNNRDLAYDAAGNIAVINTAVEWLRIFSRGGSTEATTGSDGTFIIGAPSTLVSVSATTPTANEQGPTAGVFTLTRTGDTAAALTVNVAWSGTASNGVDYALLGNTVTFAAGATSTNISVVPVDDAIAEISETVVLTLAAGTGYGTGTPSSATGTILDNESPVIDVNVTQPILLESYANSKGRFQVARRGLLTSALTVNLSYSGTATRTVDFNGPLSVNLAAGAATTNLTVTPINDLAYEGDETIIIGAAAGTGYTASTNVATITVIDDEYPTKPVLFSDAFDTDSSANWMINFPGGEAFADFNFDYSTLGIPSAPYSSGTTRGVKFTVNTSEGLVNGISISPIGQNFTNDYRLEFDMWINVNGPLPGGGTGSTEFFNAGIGTTGDHPNYFAGNSDGAWFSADGDGGTGAVTGDYNAYYGLDKAQDASGVYVAGTTGGPRDNIHPYYALWGGDAAPAQQQLDYAQQTGATDVGAFGMAWHRGAITKIGEVVTWSIDGRNMANLTNTSPTTFTSTGNIFVGYHDQFPSVSDNAALSFGLVDNVRVLNLVAVTVPAITAISVITGGTEIQIDFTGAVGGSFTLLSSATVNGTYTGTAATFSTTGSGTYRFVTAVNGAQRFYRIQGN